MKYQIWSEGYLVSGMEGIPEKAHFWGEIEANSFKEACDEFFKDDPAYDASTGRLWMCRLFDNEADARKFLG